MKSQSSMNRIAIELAERNGLRKVVEYIADGNPEVVKILIYIRGNFKESDRIIKWLKDNKMCGKKCIEFFQNESDASGGGYLLGVQKILSMIDGHKHSVRAVKINELK